MDPPKIHLLRFADLKAANVVTNWPQLRRLVDRYGFPPGYLLSPGARVWNAAEVEGWLEVRRQAAVPARPPIQPAA